MQSRVHNSSSRPAIRLGALCAGLLASLAFSGAVFAQEAPVPETPAEAPVAAPARVVNGPQVSIKTTLGEIVLELDPEKAPKTVANFLQYVKDGFYKGMIFHRVIDGFMIQTGGMDAKMVSKQTRKPIKSEANNGLHNEPYSVAMAREAGVDTATSQFFINVANNLGLDYPAMGGGYTVFGKVIKGQEVVDKIKGVVVDDMKGQQNVPVVPIVITSVSVIKK